MPASIIDSFDHLPVMLNAVHISEVLGISRTVSYTLFHREDFPTIRIGNRYLVARDHFVDWLNKQAAPVV